MSQLDPVTTFLTQEAFDRLQAELAELEGPTRAAVVDRIETAREEGDLKENGGYHAAKEEQGKLEARIRQLTLLLRSAAVGSATADDGTAGPGTIVTVRFAGDTGTEKFLVGSREESAVDVDVYSPQSPIGQAVTGHRAGDSVSYVTPAGKTIGLEILDVAALHG
jgi:transcription elongation factor GreA